MIKIAHLGAYGLNLGDTVALNNIRLQVAKYTKEEIRWVPINITVFHGFRNNIKKTCAYFQKHLDGVDALIVGGGGLIECGPQHHDMETGWKLPFSEKMFESYGKDFPPIYVIGAGINYFRKYSEEDQFNRSGVESLKDLINRARFFSVRNDGSYTKIMKLLGGDAQLHLRDKISEIPDPGLIYDHEVPRRTKEECEDLPVAFQPAFNNNRGVMAGRSLSLEDSRSACNRKQLYRLVRENDLKVLPHTPKDFRDFEEHESLVSKLKFTKNSGIEEYSGLLDLYNTIKASVAMRGHGQMIALGLNVPSVYFSTQDKVLNFSQQHQLMEYNVDIEDPDWYQGLQQKMEKICHDEEYRLVWYEKRDKLVNSFKRQFEIVCHEIINDIEENKK